MVNRRYAISNMHILLSPKEFSRYSKLTFNLCIFCLNLTLLIWICLENNRYWNDAQFAKYSPLSSLISVFSESTFFWLLCTLCHVLGKGWVTSHGLPALSRVWQHEKLSDVSLGICPRYSLVVDKYVKKINK